MAGSFLLNAINSTYLSINCVQNLKEMHNIEKRAGVGLTTVGQLLMESKVENDTEYREARSKFYRFHGLSSLANLLSIAATVTQVYFLTHKQYSLV